MALVESQEVALRISAQTAGQADVSGLADRLEALAREGEAVAPQLAAITEEVRRLGQQQVRLDGLQAAIGAAKGAHAAVREARHEVQVLDKTLADAKGAGANAQTVRLLEKELAAANRQLASAERAWNSQNAALKATRAEAAAAGVDVKNLGQAQQQLAASFDAASAKVEAQVEAVRAAREAEKARAAEARAQAQEEERLAGIVAASKAKLARAAQDQLAAEKRAYAEAEAAAKRYAEQNRAIAAGVQNAFSAIGIRSSATIKAEILAIQQGLQRLAGDATISGKEFDRVFAAGQKRISELNTEMSGAVDPFTASVGRATGGVAGLVTKLKPVALAVAAAFSAEHIARTAVEFDSLNRTLTAIKGSGKAAAAELGYIVTTANRLGLELSSASKAYAQFLAVTRGTSLEGQKARDIFEAVAGSMAKLGKSSADTEGALLAISQMVSKGVVSLEELRQQLAERLPGALKAAADGAGLTEAELIKMVESGQVLAEDLLPALATQLNKLYGTSNEVEGYAASWNRLTSGVTNAIGALTQTSVVMGTVTTVLAVLRETILILGTGFVTAAESVSFFGRVLSATAENINPAKWGKLREEIGKLADESIQRINQIASQTMIAKGVQDALGDSTAAAAGKAAESAPGWLAVANAYAKVNAAADAFVKQSEKALQARQAEAAAITAYAQMSGDEVQQRQAEADAALGVASATAQLAQAKAAQLGALQSQLAAQEQVIAGDGKESDAKRKLIEDTRQKVALAEQEASQAAASAQQAQMEAAHRQASAQAVRDHSAQLDALRTSYQAAQQAARNLEEDERAGIATTDALNAARARAIQANTLYRDAIADNIRRIDAEGRAKQAAMAVEERLAQLKLVAVQGAEKSARAYGNELAAAWKVIEAKRQEARIAELKAQAQRAEATAQLEKIKAQEADLTATDRLDKAKMAELEAAKASATAKQIEGQISAELAKQLHAEADAAIRAMNAKRGEGEATESAGDSAGEAAQSVESLGAATQGATSITAVFAEAWLNAIDAIRQVAPAAAEALGQVQDTSHGFWDFAARVRGLSSSAAELVASNPLGDLQGQLQEVQAAASAASAQLEVMDNINHKMNMGLSFAGWRESLAAMKQLELSLLQAKQSQIELSIEVQRYNNAVEAGNDNLRWQESMLANLVGRAEELGSQELSGLRSALDSVRQQMQAVADASRSTLDSVADELDQLNGRFVEIEQRRAESRRADIEAQLSEARASGNTQAMADLNAALAKLAEIERLRVADARARESEAAKAKSTGSANAQEPAPATATTAAPTASSSRSVTTHRVELAINDRLVGTVTVGSAAEVSTVQSFLDQVAEQARRAA